MVKSILDPSITYKETQTTEENDKNYDANLYQSNIYDTEVIIAIGKPDYTYIDKNIIYYHIYLIDEKDNKTQIGIYEIYSTQQENLLDEDGDIDLNQLNDPLLYSSTYSLIHNEVESVIQETQREQKEDMLIKEKTEKPIISSKKSTKRTSWIQEYMNDDNYNITDTKYDGDCFFSALKIALEEREQDVSIDEMRQKLVDNATEELFENYKVLYDNYKTREDSLTREIKNITKRHNNLKDTIKQTKDRNLQLSYIKQSEDMQDTHKSLKTERKDLKELKQEVEFMNGLDNLSMLKLKLKTRDFWADTWAISTLERELNIKTIIFSENNYKEGDELNVLQCGQLNDPILEQNGIFEPSFYVMIAHHGGYHYQIITYDEMNSFTFDELPEKVKDLISDKCLEKISGPYSLIPEFKELNEKLMNKDVIIINDTNETGEDKMSEEQVFPTEETVSDLYDKSTVFRFYSKSTDKPLPGHGAGEKLGPEGDSAYEELAKISQWRKKLSNFWPAEFTLDGHRWLSVEHYYQGSKFKKNNKEFYIQFSLDSPDSSIAKDAALAKAAGGKSGKFKGELVRPKNVKIDPDFFMVLSGSKYKRGEIDMEDAMREKFTQNPDLKKLLLATKNAKLEHITRGKPAIVFNDLMRVRRELREKE
jgi:predicted NAD-dependent protein-ADP-ribosyltransferase YbiA (DUF1768 family)